jgi:hypothetical protein
VAGLVPACITATANTGVYLTSQNAIDAGFDLSSYTSGWVNQNVSASSSATVTGNAVVTLEGGTVTSLVGGSGFGSSAVFEVNSAVTVTSWNNNAASARVDNNAAVSVGTLTLGGSLFSVIQSGASAAITLNNVDFTARSLFTAAGTLHISGGTAHIGAYGTTSGSVTGSGSIKLSGGVSVDGTIPQTVTLNVVASGRSPPLAVVDASTTLKASGNINGDGTILVNGRLELGTTSVSANPKVIVNTGATLLIDASQAFSAKAVDVYSGAVLVIGANANKGTATIDRIAQCLGTVRIMLSTTASAFVSSSGGTATVALRYSSNNVPADLSKCAVEIVDSDSKTYSLTSTTSAAVGRRLLASSGTATWGQNSMTYTMTSTNANAAAFSFALLPILASGMVGILM